MQYFLSGLIALFFIACDLTSSDGGNDDTGMNTSSSSNNISSSSSFLSSSTNQGMSSEGGFDPQINPNPVIDTTYLESDLVEYDIILESGFSAKYKVVDLDDNSFYHLGNIPSLANIDLVFHNELMNDRNYLYTPIGASVKKLSDGFLSTESWAVDELNNEIFIVPVLGKNYDEFSTYEDIVDYYNSALLDELNYYENYMEISTSDNIIVSSSEGGLYLFNVKSINNSDQVSVILKTLTLPE